MRLLRLLKRDLHNEFREWMKDDIISETQSEILSNRYGIDIMISRNILLVIMFPSGTRK